MDLADASMVVLADELGHGRILSTDQRDFSAYRWKNHEPFENLLLPDEYRIWIWFPDTSTATSKLYLSRLRIPRLECVGFGEWLGAKAQD